ncbi:hypothetical protein LX32DRAFT_639431 [Colletotrichum zoysiae]|uniref:Uncharacterized protein n=1 Tax=Colletotrichum zoysiae TaxID=1216348 RepID=A0AAD9HJ88_9PEZI|nr:hypothetical protein LX32DRAFT_639431 [Colletotrichum zoysiae]
MAVQAAGWLSSTSAAPLSTGPHELPRTCLVEMNLCKIRSAREAQSARGLCDDDKPLTRCVEQLCRSREAVDD